MKKLAILFLVCCMILGGCGNGGVSQEEYDKVVAERDELKERLSSLEEKIGNDEGADASQDEEKSQEKNGNIESNEPTESGDGGIEILAEYTLSDSVGWYTRHFMVLKNNSNKTVKVSTSSLAYSADNKMIGAADASLDALGAGCTSVLYEAFETDEGIDHYETEVKCSEDGYYKSVIQDLSYEKNDVDKGAVFQVTNGGEDAAEFVRGYALFFLNGELVGYDDTYFTDDDSELKPGETISKQLTSHKEFDAIEFYLMGKK